MYNFLCIWLHLLHIISRFEKFSNLNVSSSKGGSQKLSFQDALTAKMEVLFLLCVLQAHSSAPAGESVSYLLQPNVSPFFSVQLKWILLFATKN